MIAPSVCESVFVPLVNGEGVREVRQRSGKAHPEGL